MPRNSLKLTRVSVSVRKKPLRKERQNAPHGKRSIKPKWKLGRTDPLPASILIQQESLFTATQTAGRANASKSRKSGTERRPRRSRPGNAVRMFVFASVTAKTLFSGFAHSVQMNQSQA